MSSSKEQVSMCPVCGHNNRPGSLMCENCGSLLNLKAESRRATRDLRDSTHALTEEEREVIDEEPENRVRGGEYRPGCDVVLQVDEVGESVRIMADMLEHPVVIGRQDPMTGQVPEVNLDDFAGYRMGVSRKHAMLEVKNEALTVTDLGSSNGTYLNGNRLAARQPEVVLERDMLRVGQVLLKVMFVDSSEEML